MATHDDYSHRPEAFSGLDMGRLYERANDMLRNRASEITAGKPGEKPLGQWDSNGVHVTQMPDDEQGILRVSIGGGIEGMNYCVFRGKLRHCVELLEQSLVALKSRMH